MSSLFQIHHEFKDGTTEMCAQEARKLFHELWTSNAGAQEYDKKKWIDLQWALQELGVPV